MTFPTLYEGLYEFSLKRVNENISWQRSTISSYWDTYNLLKNLTTALYKYIINEEVDRSNNVVFCILVFRIGMTFIKIC